MEGAVGRIQAVYQSMLKEHEVSTNAVLEVGITVKNRKKGASFVGIRIRWNLPRPCLNCEGGCWYCLKLGWEGEGL